MNIEEYPQAIAEIEKKGLELKFQAQRAKDSMDRIKRAIISEVAGEKDEAGKKKFSNAEAREIEVESRLAEEPAYQDLVQLLSKVEEDRATNEINLQQLKDEFSVTRYKLRLLTAEKTEQASIHFCEGLKILSGLGDIIKSLTKINQQEQPEETCPF